VTFLIIAPLVINYDDDDINTLTYLLTSLQRSDLTTDDAVNRGCVTTTSKLCQLNTEYKEPCCHQSTLNTSLAVYH